jgi:cytochrome c5
MTIPLRALTRLTVIAFAAAAFGLPHPAATAKKQPKQQTAGAHQDPGERAFQANCSRCHYAPEQLSPSISGTIVRHMRIRANLSADDEKAILRYLGP